jgi:hypothetical protein
MLTLTDKEKVFELSFLRHLDNVLRGSHVAYEPLPAVKEKNFIGNIEESF